MGETPEMWPTEEAVRLGRFVDASPRHRDRLDRLPGSAEQVLVRAMSLKPHERFATPNELAAELAASFGTRATYRHTEAKEIVRMAADLQLQNPTRDDALSLGGVQQIAAEVGIPPHYVERAAKSLDQPEKRPSHNPFLRTAVLLEFERTVEGEFPESEYPELVDEIRATLGTIGEIDTLGRSLTWRTQAIQGGRQVSVSVRPRAGRTTICIQERLGNLAGGLFGGIMGGGGGGGTGIALGLGLGAGIPVLALSLAGLAIGGSYAIARLIFTTTARRKAAELSDLIDRLAESVTDTLAMQRQLPR